MTHVAKGIVKPDLYISKPHSENQGITTSVNKIINFGSLKSWLTCVHRYNTMYYFHGIKAFKSIHNFLWDFCEF